MAQLPLPDTVLLAQSCLWVRLGQQWEGTGLPVWGNLVRKRHLVGGCLTVAWLPRRPKAVGHLSIWKVLSEGSSVCDTTSWLQCSAPAPGLAMAPSPQCVHGPGWDSKGHGAALALVHLLWALLAYTPATYPSAHTVHHSAGLPHLPSHRNEATGGASKPRQLPWSVSPVTAPLQVPPVTAPCTCRMAAAPWVPAPPTHLPPPTWHEAHLEWHQQLSASRWSP